MEQAIFTDCHTLVHKFVKNGNPQFLSFCAQWKAMMFQHIFSAQSSTTEVLETTIAALYVAKRMLYGEQHDDDYKCSSFEMQLERIGGLYLLYALYFKQPTKEFNKIDVTLRGWKQIRQFIESLDANDTSLDGARCIFWKLFKANAFRLCAHDFHLGLENLVDYDNLQNKTATGEVVENALQGAKLLQEIRDLRETKSMLPALTTLEDGYNEMKELLVKNQASGSSTLASQTLPATTIFKDMQKVFNDIQNILAKPITMSSDQKSTEKKSKPRDQTDLKCYLTKNIDASDTEESIEWKRIGRMSGRTVFAETLPIETLEDLQCDNDDDEEGENANEMADRNMPDFEKEAEDVKMLDQEEFIAN